MTGQSILKSFDVSLMKTNEEVRCMPYVKSSDQLAYIFTKGVSSKVFDFIFNKFGMINICAQLEGEC